MSTNESVRTTTSRVQQVGRVLARRLRPWWPAVAWAGVIFAASSAPGAAVPGQGWDKAGHLTAYAVLGILVARGVAGGHVGGLTPSKVLVAALLATLYGVSDEWHQAFVPTRTPEALDIVADAAGALLGSGGAWAWSIYFHPRGESCRTRTSSSAGKDRRPPVMLQSRRRSSALEQAEDL